MVDFLLIAILIMIGTVCAYVGGMYFSKGVEEEHKHWTILSIAYTIASFLVIYVAYVNP